VQSSPAAAPAIYLLRAFILAKPVSLWYQSNAVCQPQLQLGCCPRSSHRRRCWRRCSATRGTKRMRRCGVRASTTCASAGCTPRGLSLCCPASTPDPPCWSCTSSWCVSLHTMPYTIDRVAQQCHHAVAWSCRSGGRDPLSASHQACGPALIHQVTSTSMHSSFELALEAGRLTSPDTASAPAPIFGLPGPVPLLHGHKFPDCLPPNGSGRFNVVYATHIHASSAGWSQVQSVSGSHRALATYGRK